MPALDGKFYVLVLQDYLTCHTSDYIEVAPLFKPKLNRFRDKK